jgi:hypothetical protein
MTTEELQQHIDDNDGYCRFCNAWTQDGGVEPDARNYECPECSNHTLFGAEETLFWDLGL